MQPHKSRYWLRAKVDDPAEFVAQVEEIRELYAAAGELEQAGVHLMSTAEMTGIQALERAAAAPKMQPGRVEHREFEYIRPGTRSLIANFEVATGRIVSPTTGPSRTEEDFVVHVQRTVASDASGRWIFILDQLNTHQSAGLVQYVAQACGLERELGVKGKSGILGTMSSRAEFLSNRAHRIRFVYTPKHCGWLNQIEIWFGILVRRLLKRASFGSLAELEQRIMEFIGYFNRTMAKVFKWTYSGRPLVA